VDDTVYGIMLITLQEYALIINTCYHVMNNVGRNHEPAVRRLTPEWH